MKKLFGLAKLVYTLPFSGLSSIYIPGCQRRFLVACIDQLHSTFNFAFCQPTKNLVLSSIRRVKKAQQKYKMTVGLTPYKIIIIASDNRFCFLYDTTGE